MSQLSLSSFKTAPMDNSRRPSNANNNNSSSTEPFPAFPAASGAPARPQDSHTTTTTTTTTTTSSSGRRNPVTTTTFTPAQDGPGPSSSYTIHGPNVVPFSRTTVSTPSQTRRRPIGIKRLPSASSLRQSELEADGGIGQSSSGRSRSNSAPSSRLSAPGLSALGRTNTRQSGLPPVQEGPLPTVEEGAVQPQQGSQPSADQHLLQVPAVESSSGVGRRRSISNAARSVISRFSNEDGDRPPSQDYDNNVVDFLDVIDPEVSTLTTLTNVQNSLFVPDFGRWINRRPTYTLSRPPTSTQAKDTSRAAPATTLQTNKPLPEEPEAEDEAERELMSRQPTMQRSWSWLRRPQPERSHSITSVMTDSHYAVLPHGATLDDWTEEDKEALDDHVRHMLHSKRSKFKRSMKAFGQYVRRPLGFFITFYAVSITLFGLAWVLFLIGWINVNGRNDYLTNVIDNVLVALFAVMGDGLAPFRMVDTYHMCYIAHYHHLTWRLRREQNLPKLPDRNDLPDRPEKDIDAEAATEGAAFSLLNPQQQKKLEHHQTKFAKSHSFYKPHETTTHHAFPLRLLVAIVVLLDCHSLFQIALGTCTWAIDYHTRPQALTATILCCSITCNITAGVLISIGDRRTRKMDVVTRMARQELTESAMKKVQKHKEDREKNMERAQTEENFQVVNEEHPEHAKPERSRSQPGGLL